MITITEKPEPPAKVKLVVLKQGDTFVMDDNRLFIVTNKHEGNNVICTRLGGKESGLITHIGATALVLQVNLLVEITRL